MLRITVTKDGGLPQVSTFDKREITIGRTKSNDLVIAEPGISSSHARLLSTGDGLTLIDLESTNGTFVNGERIRGPALLQPGDEVYICAYRLDFDAGGPQLGAADGPPPMVTPPPPVDGPPMLGDMSGGPEYPTPVEPTPPPMAGDAPHGPPMLGGPPAEAAGFDGPPPMIETPPPVAEPPAMDEPGPVEGPPPLQPPPSIAEPAAVDDPAPPPPVATPDFPPAGGDEPGADEPEPLAAPPPVIAPEGAPAPVEADDSRPVEVSGLISPPDDIPDVTPRSAPRAPGPVIATPGPAQRMSTVEQPVSPHALGYGPAPVSPPTPVDPMPAPLGVPGVIVPPTGTAPMPLTPPDDDLSDLKGPGAGARACARVFALVQYDLAPDGRLPGRDPQTRSRARNEATRLLASVAERVPDIQPRPWANRIANELCGLGALSVPLAEPDVLDIYVHGPDRVLVRRNSEPPTPIEATFSCPAAVELVVRRLTDRPFGPGAPIIEGRTPEGADIRAVHGSMTSPGPLVTIHRGTVDSTARGLETLVQRRALPSGLATLLHHCMQAGLNLLVCGGPGARTFPWLAALAAEAPSEDRVVVVRPGPEPDPLPANAVVLHGGALPPRHGLSGPQWAIRGALSLAPDRLVVHQVAGSEASEVVSAMSRGLSGTICSVRAASAERGLALLTALAGLAGDAPDAAARARHVAQSVDVIIAVSRFADGHTRATQLAEATVTSAGTTQAVDLVTYQPDEGTWAATGVAPTFFAQMQRRGITVDVGLLSE